MGGEPADGKVDCHQDDHDGHFALFVGLLVGRMQLVGGDYAVGVGCQTVSMLSAFLDLARSGSWRYGFRFQVV